MKNTLKIFGFTILVTAFYGYVGQMVPQKEAYPPESAELRDDMTVDELVAAGQEIVGGKGTCLGCHTIGSDGGGRFPDLAGIGARAAERRPGMDDVAYLAEALYDPNAYIVEGFLPGMPAVQKPPIGLTGPEMRAVIAYLQSLGGTPSVTLATALPYEDAAPAATAAPAAAVAAVPGPARDAETLFQEYLCATCHSLDAPTPMVGPSLADVGRRLSKAEIYAAIVDPDAEVAEGYPGGVMGATLQAAGFMDKVTTKELRTLVDFLATHRGE